MEPHQTGERRIRSGGNKFNRTGEKTTPPKLPGKESTVSSFSSIIGRIPSEPDKPFGDERSEAPGPSDLSWGKTNDNDLERRDWSGSDSESSIHRAHSRIYEDAELNSLWKTLDEPIQGQDRVAYEDWKNDFSKYLISVFGIITKSTYQFKGRFVYNITFEDFCRFSYYLSFH